MPRDSDRKRAEIRLKKAFDAEREDYIYDLWADRGEELIVRLSKMMNLPVMGTDKLGVLQFCRVRYQKEGELRSKWLKKRKAHKKWSIISKHWWSFYPIEIYPKTHSIDPKNHRYVFIAEYIAQECGKRDCYYSGRIETAFDGSVLEWLPDNGHDPLPSLPKFPKSMLAKINRCLANNFLPDLWRGEGYAKWHRMDEGIYRYMLTYGYERESYIEPLLSLLRSNYGGAAAILLAFSCFSVTKPFFPQYKSLDKTSRYLQAKKYIPEQISINIRSDSPNTALQLAKLCCGCFRPDELHTEGSGHRSRRDPVIDGVVIQYSHKSTYLGLDSFEETVLQPASVLWVNRRPAPELVKSGRIIDIALPSDIEEIGDGQFVLDMIADWTKKISDITLKDYHATQEADGEKLALGMNRMLTELETTILQYKLGEMKDNLQYSGIDLRMIEKMAYLHTSFQRFADDCIPEENRKEVLSIFEKSLDELFAKYKRFPKEILEEYIKSLLTKKHFARVRGKGSDRPDVCVWYDARDDRFLLPKDTYFSDLQQLFPGAQGITQIEWEKRLVEADLLQPRKSTKQKRYSHDIQLQYDSDKKTPVLKIKVSKLSKEFSENDAVRSAIEQMKADPSKLRSRTRSLSAGK